MLKFVTKVNHANSKSTTLRTSIPKEIVNSLDLSHGDDLVWNIDVVDGEMKIIVSKNEWFIFLKIVIVLIYTNFLKNWTKAFAKPLKLPMLNSLNSILYLNNFKAFFKVKYKYI